MQIQVGKMPGRIQPITAPEGTTVGEVLALHNPPLSTDGYEVRISGQPVALDRVVEDGDRVLLFRSVKGNRIARFFRALLGR